MLASLFFLPSLQKKGWRERKKSQITTILRNPPPPPPSPDAPSDCCPETGALDAAFDAMLLNIPTVTDDNFIDNWGAIDTEEALALSGVDDNRLKNCIINALASIWGMPMMRPGQLEADFCILHSHRPYFLVVVHWTGGGRHTSYELLV